MNETRRRQAVELTEQIMRSYYCRRDIDAVLEHLAPDVTWIGPGQQEKQYTLDGIRTYFQLGRNSIPSCEVTAPDLRAVDLGEDCCIVVGSMTIRTTPDSQMVLEVDQRLSFTYRFAHGRLEIVHMHLSNPYGEMGADEYFPHKIGTQSYEYLQRLLSEKMEVLDMIASNINGGLKGSNDDSTFSFFYVNEGLPRMLGYTHEEFMEKTGGTAVGAVYPPDLAAALADCERCFAQGPVYSTEYRVEKKDGSLMWVLDSGRKAVDSEGITRINSILMDITPLKQALFDLGVEQERYRVALEHITGAMCEYDVEQDVFTIYRHVAQDGKRSIQPLEIPVFSKVVAAGTLADEENGAALLARCTGQETGSLELQARLPQEDGWYWIQFGCSVIRDHGGTPVRAVGVLKDITEERQRNQTLLDQAQRDGLTGLLNHTTVKEVIQTYLTEHTGTHPRQCALMMVDLDRFKEVNDLNGHAYGDQVLMQTARILEAAAGTDGIVGRIGGDEFLILAKEAEPSDAAHRAEEMVRQVRGIGTEKGYSVTCSIGVAPCLPQETFSQLFERADKALYQAKHKGRDRVFLDSAPL